MNRRVNVCATGCGDDVVRVFDMGNGGGKALAQVRVSCVYFGFGSNVFGSFCLGVGGVC